MGVLVVIVVAIALLLTFLTALFTFVIGIWRATPKGGRFWRGIPLMSFPGALVMVMIVYAVVNLISK